MIRGRICTREEFVSIHVRELCSKREAYLKYEADLMQQEKDIRLEAKRKIIDLWEKQNRVGKEIQGAE